jgi:hypothetical protein
MARKMALFTTRFLSSWGDSMRGIPIPLQKQPSVKGVDGRFFAASSKGKGAGRGKVLSV